MFRTPAKTDRPSNAASPVTNKTLTLGAGSPIKTPPLQLEMQKTPEDKSRSTEGTGKVLAKSLTLTFSPPRKATHNELPIQKVHAASQANSKAESSQQNDKYPVKRKDRLTEAKACVEKANMLLENSRNIKTGIKTEVLTTIGRLYELVEEAEVENRQINRSNKAKTKTVDCGMMTLPENTEDSDKISEAMTSHENGNYSLMKKLEENTKLIKESNEKLEALRDTVEAYKMEVNETRASYASVTANKPILNTLMKQTLHSLAITTNNTEDTGEDILNKVRNALNATDGDIEIERVRKAKDRKIIIGCRTQAERERVKERLRKEGSHLSVEEIKNKDPLIMIIGALRSLKDEDLFRALRNQNKKIFGSLSEGDCRMEVAYKIRNRNPHTQRVVLRVAPALWKNMTGSGFVRVDIQTLKVEDRSPLVQCSMCLAYGHGKRLCTETEPRCSHCGGLHLKAECREYISGSVPSCINCCRNKKPNETHNAFSETCPIREKWDRLARAAVAYC